jgi:NadR type nicotinamide-nucleotide adenylyltransferase
MTSPHDVTRIVCIGAESTGTTTLAEALADHYETVWVPEFGRTYSEGRRPALTPWRTEEFVFIAEEQARMEDALAELANRVVICDTDPFATAIWHERYMGRPSEAVLAVAARRRYDLYIVTDVNIPFVADRIRDGESIRHWMHQRFLDELAKQPAPVMVVTGRHQRRLAAAIARIDALLR